MILVWTDTVYGLACGLYDAALCWLLLDWIRSLAGARFAVPYVLRHLYAPRMHALDWVVLWWCHFIPDNITCLYVMPVPNNWHPVLRRNLLHVCRLLFVYHPGCVQSIPPPSFFKASLAIVARGQTPYLQTVRLSRGPSLLPIVSSHMFRLECCFSFWRSWPDHSFRGYPIRICLRRRTFASGFETSEGVRILFVTYLDSTSWY